MRISHQQGFTRLLSLLCWMWESATRSHRGKCRSQICSPGRCPYLAEGHIIFSTNHTEVQQPSPRLSSVWSCSEGMVCCTGTHKCQQGQMPIPVMYLTCRAQVRALIVMYQHLPSLLSSYSPPCSQPQQPNAHSTNYLTTCLKETEMHLLVPATGENCNM